MIRRLLSIATAIALLVGPAHALERWYSGNDLLAACRVVSTGSTPTSENAQLVEVCLGEIEALDWAAPGMQNEKLQSCVPDDVTIKQVAKVIIDFLDQNPERRGEPFEGLALEALALTRPRFGDNRERE